MLYTRCFNSLKESALKSSLESHTFGHLNKCSVCQQMFSAQTSNHSLRLTLLLYASESHTFKVDLPLPDGGVETLPVAALDGVIIVQVLLLVLLHRGGRCRLLSRKDLRCHLLLLLGLQSDYLITHRGQLGWAAGTPLFGAFTRPALNRLWKHQQERQTFHVPSLGIHHECVHLQSSGKACREDAGKGMKGLREVMIFGEPPKAEQLTETQEKTRKERRNKIHS